MILVLHILFATLGLAGSYAYAHAYVQKCTELKTILVVQSLTHMGLAGSVLTGVVLFMDDAERFLDSGKFLSNMFVLAVLVLLEVLFHFVRRRRMRILARIVSAYSWTWIFAAALIDLPYPLIYFAGAYVATAALLSFVTCYNIPDHQPGEV